MKHAASITLKNVLKRNWGAEDQSRICAEDRASVKAVIVELMLVLPESLQKQLSEGIACVGRHDFPKNWTELLPSMVTRFESGDFHMINGVLRTLYPLFHRWVMT